MNKEELRNNAYFQSLTPWMQENILMSGVRFVTEQDIRTFAQNLKQEGDENGQG